MNYSKRSAHKEILSSPKALYLQQLLPADGYRRQSESGNFKYPPANFPTGSIDGPEAFKSGHYDRIKNNIATIGSLLSMQQRSSTNSVVKAGLNEAIGRIKNMAELYDKMLIADDYRSISSASYSSALANAVVALFSGLFENHDDGAIREFSAQFKTGLSGRHHHQRAADHPFWSTMRFTGS